jgi:hypothetical protein
MAQNINIVKSINDLISISNKNRECLTCRNILSSKYRLKKCLQCYYRENIIISKTNVKEQYMLSDEDLLHIDKCDVYKNSNRLTMFLIRDVKDYFIKKYNLDDEKDIEKHIYNNSSGKISKIIESNIFLNRRRQKLIEEFNKYEIEVNYEDEDIMYYIAYNDGDLSEICNRYIGMKFLKEKTNFNKRLKEQFYLDNLNNIHFFVDDKEEFIFTILEEYINKNGHKSASDFTDYLASIYFRYSK